MLNRRTFASILVLPALATGAAHAVIVGQAAPDFSATDALGKSHKLSDFKGKLVVLEWTNPGCPFVVKHYSKEGGGNMQALQKEFTAKGVVWLSINSTHKQAADYLEPAKLMAWTADKNGAASAMLMDDSGKLGQLYGAKTTPHMYIINPQGLLVYAGAIDSVPTARDRKSVV